MKGENLLKMSHRHYVGYSSGGVTVPNPTQNKFGCGAGVTIPRRANSFNIRHVRKDKRGLKHDVLVMPAASVKPRPDEGLRTNGSAISGVSAPLMHH